MPARLQRLQPGPRRDPRAPLGAVPTAVDEIPGLDFMVAARASPPAEPILSLSAISGVWRQFFFFKDGQCAYILILEAGLSGALSSSN